MKFIIMLSSIAAGVFLLLSLLLYLFQEKMLFQPNLSGRALTVTPADIGLEYEDVSMLTRDDEQLHGWYVPAPESRGVLLFFHGNAGNISGRLDSIQVFNQLGLDVLIIDYRGYGQSTGTASEQGTYLDALAAWNYLVEDRGLAPEQIIIFGRSLGGAVAAWLGTQHKSAAVIIESAFTSIVDMARRLYPFLPVRWFTRMNYPVAEYASQLQSPVLVVHSRDDEIIPFEMGRSIYAAVTQPRSFIELRGDHNNGFFISRQVYMAGLEDFTGSVFGQGIFAE